MEIGSPSANLLVCPCPQNACQPSFPPSASTFPRNRLCASDIHYYVYNFLSSFPDLISLFTSLRTQSGDLESRLGASRIRTGSGIMLG